MKDAARKLLAADPRIAYALLFGSAARGSGHGRSDLDVAIGLSPGCALGTLEIGDLTARLEEAAACPVDLVLLDEAPPGLAYRIFRDGMPIVVRDAAALAARRARAVLEYLDFQPFEELFTRRILDSAAHGR